jgi:predicted  nucleic acid-binding Zn-ribbon protein
VASQVGSAFIPVKPDMRGWHKAIGAEFKAMSAEAEKWGADAGKRFASGFQDELRARFAKLPTATVQADADTAKADAELDRVARDRTARINVKAFGGGVAGKLGAVGGVTALGGGAVALAGPLAAATVAFGSFAAVALPSLSKVHDALTKTGDAGKKAWDKLTPAQRKIATGAKDLQAQFGKLQKSMQPLVAQVAGLAVKTAKDLLPALGPLAKAGGSVLSSFLKPLDKFAKSPAFGTFVSSFAKFGVQAGRIVGPQLIKLVAVFLKLFEQLMPTGISVLRTLLPSLVTLAQDLTPIIEAGAKVFDWTTKMLAKFGLLGPVLVGLGAAWLIGFGPVGWAVGAITLVVLAITHFWRTSSKFRDVVESVFSTVGQVILTFAELWLNEIKFIGDLLFGFVGKVASLLAKIPGPWQKTMQSVSKSINGAKTTFDNFIDGAHSKLAGWKTDLANMPKIAKLKGDITDLTAKLNTAERQLKNPDLTKTRRAQIKADITQLQDKLAEARQELARLNGTSVTTYVVTRKSTVYSPNNPLLSGKHAMGGIIRLASGGFTGMVRGPGGPTADQAGLFALSNGEYVVRAAAVARYGRQALDAINTGQAPIGGGQFTGSLYLDSGQFLGTVEGVIGKHDAQVVRRARAGTGGRG